MLFIWKEEKRGRLSLPGSPENSSPASRSPKTINYEHFDEGNKLELSKSFSTTHQIAACHWHVKLVPNLVLLESKKSASSQTEGERLIFPIFKQSNIAFVKEKNQKKKFKAIKLGEIVRFGTNYKGNEFSLSLYPEKIIEKVWRFQRSSKFSKFANGLVRISNF